MFLFVSTASANIGYEVAGVTIRCYYSGAESPSSYRWEVFKDGDFGGDTGWNSDGNETKFTFETGGHVTIIMSINVSGVEKKTLTNIFIDKDGYYHDTENPDFYNNAEDCVDAGFHWWDQRCHNCTRPYVWDTVEEPPEAIEFTLDTIASRPEVKIGIIVLLALGVLIFYTWRNKKWVKPK